MKLDQNINVTEGTNTYRFDYDDQGNVCTYTAGKGSGSTFNYDYANKIKDLVVGTSNSILLSEQYEYEPINQLLSETYQTEQVNHTHMMALEIVHRMENTSIHGMKLSFESLSLHNLYYKYL